MTTGGGGGELGHEHEHPWQHGALDCSQALLRMFEYLDGEMTGADASQIQTHLDECAECLRQYHLDQMVKIVVKRSCAAQQAPVTLRQTILQRITVLRVDASDEVG
ncbi:MAG: mycothiol system anti-sigma-R factor [Dermatophilaceae bacterium]